MLKKALILVGVALALVTAVSAEIPIPPCAPCLVDNGPAR